jgi:DNA invertase Pin-like site-specific DNA recombinase
MRIEEIAGHHRARFALVYVRQSTTRQLRDHRESQRRQRDLVHRPVELGWPEARVRLIDEDLGVSASRSQVRAGFTDMVAETALGNVGLILSLEVSRLSRSNRDWYHLLDVCAVTRTLIGDGEAVYDPRAYDDRMLLGLKGTMSEAELHVMKQRMVEAVLARARRGEHRVRLAPGYVWDEAGRIVKSPDEQERAAVEMVFARFARVGTIRQTQVSLAEEGVELPVRVGSTGRVRYRVASIGQVTRILKNPTYAGAYAYGRRQIEEILDGSQRPRKRLRECPREEWHALIRDHHEGYVTWEEYERVQRQIAVNVRSGGAGPGAPREGAALLAGLVLCGGCGRRMAVHYGRGGRLVRYHCAHREPETGERTCRGFGGRRLERAVEGLLLEALAPLGVEAMLEATRAHEEACEERRRHERLRVKRARYEVDLARRQYEAVDPENRLVASELERRWETALRDLASTEREAEARVHDLSPALSAGEEAWLRECARDIGRLWRAETTRAKDRKRIARCLIETIVVKVPERGERLEAEVHWVGGEVSTLEIRRGRTGAHRHVTDPEVVDLVRMLAAEFTDDQIAAILSRKGLRTAKGLRFRLRHITNLRSRYDIVGSSARTMQGEEVYAADRACELFGVTPGTIKRWCEVGLLRGRQMTPCAPWRVRVTEEDRRRLAVAEEAPEGWVSLQTASRVLGISQAQVFQSFGRGQLQGVRVRTPRGASWHFLVDATVAEPEASLFRGTDIPGGAV